MVVLTFYIVDWIIFLLMLLGSVLIGIYFGCFGGKQKTQDEYLLGNKRMSIFPIALSLIASFISGSALLAVPAEIYNYGTHYALIAFAPIVNSLFTIYITMPVFYYLRLTSGYEYLKMRFGEETRKLASLIFIFSSVLKMPIWLYLPSVALSQSTNIHVHIIAPVVSAICIFYTSIGGLKAVVWTDALQFLLMIISTIMVMILGTIAQNSFTDVFKIPYEGHRFDFNFTLDLTIRDTFWTTFLGVCTLHLGLGINQAYLQKCLALPNMQHVKRMLWIFSGGKIIFTLFSIYTGLLIYAKFYSCDPLSSKKISKPDQILPLYILEIGQKIPGLAGLFIAGVFSASLSSLSGYLNALSCTIYRDFILPYMAKDTSELKISYILKFICLIVGVLSTLLVFMVEHLGNILPLIMSLFGAINGPLLGLFCLGMLFPFANKKGAIAGVVTAIVCMSIILCGSYYYKYKRVIVYPQLALSTEDCPEFNVTMVTKSSTEEPLFIFRISYYCYTSLGAIIVMIVGPIVSLLTNKDDNEVSEELISPVMRWAVHKKSKGLYLSVDKALNLIEQTNESEQYKRT